MTPALRVRGLSYAYPDGHAALKGVNFELGEDETLAILGPNGAGKSTLLLHLVGLITPPAGTVEVMGMPLDSRSLKRIRQETGMLFQEPDDQLFCPTVFDDVAFGPLNLGQNAGEVRENVARSLALTGMAGTEERAPHHLSLGEKKRVALACVLAVSPRILLMDEPTANLDPGGRWEFIFLLGGIAGSKIIVTHDLELAGELATRVMVMDKGEIAAMGRAEDILSDRELLARHRLARPLKELDNAIHGYRKNAVQRT
jgi:cobalt/nickel transport system ATP-binding protein